MKQTWAAIVFTAKTRHKPSTYRKLFRDLSNLFLTDNSPGEAVVSGFPVRVVTNKPLLDLRIGGVPYQIDREKLTCLGISIADKRHWRLRRVLDSLIKGIPFKMSDDFVTYPEGHQQ